MNQLYPIIRRIRRPLLPPDDPLPVVPVPVAPVVPPSPTLGEKVPEGRLRGTDDDSRQRQSGADSVSIPADGDY